MSKRFVIEKKDIDIDADNKKIHIKGTEVSHINVLRHKVGDTLYLNEYEVLLEFVSKEKIVGKILDEAKPVGVPLVNITLFASYLKSDKMDLVITKAVELGVSKIFPMITKNTVVKLDDKDCVKKHERFSKIVISAIEQCGRTDEVKLEKIINIKEAMNNLDVYDSILVAHEKSDLSIKKVLEDLKEKNVKNIALFVGPEGGFDFEEIEKLTKIKNVSIVSLGSRVLRAETANVAILSMLNYEFEL